MTTRNQWCVPPVLSRTREQPSQSSNARQIGTELSHDVLNQLAYHFKWRTAMPLRTHFQPQDVMSRHRGCKHRRRYELLGGISLLSPGTFYPLSDGPSIQNHRITKTFFVPARAVTLAVKLAYAFALTA